MFGSALNIWKMPIQDGVVTQVLVNDIKWMVTTQHPIIKGLLTITLQLNLLFQIANQKFIICSKLHNLL